ncbi:hypothetical protein IJG14_08880 [bacterium]|nr:hypothetical protein [bacterium]
MKKIILLLTILLIGTCSYAIEADDSVDEIIKKTFNTGSNSLPKLPQTSPASIQSTNFLDVGNNQEKQKIFQSNNSTKQTDTNIQKIPNIPQQVNVRTSKIGWGKKIPVKLNTNVSDRTQKGTRVVFISQAPIYTKHITLPVGTQIYGTVVNSHSPQCLGNGGLLSIKADYVIYNNKTSYCEGNIISINHNKVLFNNIKGKNGYIKGINKVLKPAKTFYNKSYKVSKKLWNSPGFIIAPITYLPGALFLTGDAIVSPMIALFHKGERVYIPKGTTAEIKLTAPAYIQY